MSNETAEILKGKVTSITKFGAFVALADGRNGMIHISEVSDSFVKDINDFLKIGQDVRVIISNVDENGRIALSLKKASAIRKAEEAQRAAEASARRIVPEEIEEKDRRNESFEDMMSRFMKTSSEKMSDLRKVTDSKLSSPGFSRKNSKKY